MLLVVLPILINLSAVCPDPTITTQDGKHMFERTVGSLHESQTVWPLASRWLDGLKKLVTTDLQNSLIAQEGSMADGVCSSHFRLPIRFLPQDRSESPSPTLCIRPWPSRRLSTGLRRRLWMTSSNSRGSSAKARSSWPPAPKHWLLSCLGLPRYPRPTRSSTHPYASRLRSHKRPSRRSHPRRMCSSTSGTLNPRASGDRPRTTSTCSSRRSTRREG